MSWCPSEQFVLTLVLEHLAVGNVFFSRMYLHFMDGREMKALNGLICLGLHITVLNSEYCLYGQ